jgi:DNA-binding NtrC family response regulator
MTEPDTPKETYQTPETFQGMIGSCPSMQEVFTMMRRVAELDVAVLLTGESGTGKDMVAEGIHRLSLRSDRKMVTVNTGAIPHELIGSELFGHEKGAFTGAVDTKKGKFEVADKSTLFLDEIGTMDEQTQVSLLRLLEHKRFNRLGSEQARTVDARIIAATNEDLLKLVEKGTFRGDLFYRFNVFNIVLPPLRERGEDIMLLAEYFCSHYCREFKKKPSSLHPGTVEKLRHYPWPGNVRELENAIMRMVILDDCGEINPNVLPEEIAKIGAVEDSVSIEVGSSLEEVEQTVICETLKSTDGNKKEAAEILGISRKALYNKLDRMDDSEETRE